MPKYTCDQCGNTYERCPSQSGRFCSMKCADEWKKEAYKGENNHFHKEKESVECEYCGQIYKVQPHRVERTKYCSKDCQMSALNENKTGENHPNYKGKVTLECEYCKEEFKIYPNKKGERRFCSVRCAAEWQSENIVGPKHPNWMENPKQELNYGFNWAIMRRKALERDGYKCVICKEGKEKLGQNPDVHHIKPIREFDNPKDANFLDNLVSLCRKHHKMLEGWGLKPANLKN